MAQSTVERRPLFVDQADSSRHSKWKENTIFSLQVILWVFQIIGVSPLVVYAMRTYYCGINEKHPHYHCATSPSVMGLGEKGAMDFELVFAISEVLSRAIVLFFCFTVMKRMQQTRRIFRELAKLSQTWVLLGTLFLCEVRLVAILTDQEDLGHEFKINEATYSFYMVDAILTTLLVAILNFVKVRDLAEGNIGEDRDLFRIHIRCCKIDTTVTKKGLVKFLLKCVIFSFWLQYFVYFLLVIFQIAFEVFDADKKYVGEKSLKAFAVLKKLGQSAFMLKISGYFWEKLFDDEKSFLGTRTPREEEPSPQHQEPRSLTDYQSVHNTSRV